MTRTIAIVGAGLSGTLSAVHLMRRASSDDLRVLLFNRSGWLARGLAYGTRSDAHVLNVPAARMSAFEEDAEHFLRFARREEPSLGPGSFVRRQIYGDYLEWIVKEARSALAEPWRFEHVTGNVDRIDLEPERGRLHIGIAAPYEADRIVLALGNFAPSDPRLADDTFFERSERYLRDPWATHAFARLDRERPILLLGSGLTMVDVALALQAGGHRGGLHALSRRGLLPQAHRSGTGPPAESGLPAALFDGLARPRCWLRVIRQQCEASATRGIDWRETLAALRHETPALWQRLDRRGRGQFIRHLQAHWDTHRHRLAPESAKALQALRLQGGLQVHAGRLQSVQEMAQGLAVSYEPPGEAGVQLLDVGGIVNCTGPATRITRLKEALLRSLQDAGALVPDEFELGLAVDDRLALIDLQGRPSKVLHYIGPFLRAKYWECTAVPELRSHAASLARHLSAAPGRRLPVDDSRAGK